MSPDKLTVCYLEKGRLNAVIPFTLDVFWPLFSYFRGSNSELDDVSKPPALPARERNLWVMSRGNEYRYLNPSILTTGLSFRSVY